MRTRPSRALLVSFVAGAVAGVSCGPVKTVGPTALVLEIYFNEARGTKAFSISGTSEVDGVPVNVFPTSQRPETLTGAALKVPETVRILLNDSRAGVPLQLTVVGLNAQGDAVEAATQVVSPGAMAETLVTVTLKPFSDTEGDGGAGGGTADAGIQIDGGASACACPSGCCDSSARCAMPITVALASKLPSVLVLSGPSGGFCTGVCVPGRADRFVNGQCLCGAVAACGDGQRCSNTRCVCDTFSNCRGCCVNGTTCEGGRTAMSCGNAGNSCGRCSGPSGLFGVCSLTGRCDSCVASDSSKCCTGPSTVNVQWPTCLSQTGDCVACDPLRSNACRPPGGTFSSPCACGDAGTCALDQACLTNGSRVYCGRPL